VTVSARDNAGNPLTPIIMGPEGAAQQVSPVVGSVLDVWVGGKLVRVYGYRAGDGSTRYTTVPPWGGGIREIQNPDGSITIDVSPTVLEMDENGINDVLPVRDRDGNVVAYGFDPFNASFDRVRATAGINESTDFLSPMMAALQGTDEGKARLTNLASDPTLRRELEQDGLMMMTKPDGKLDVEAWNRLTQQIDRLERMGSGPIRAEDDPAGFGFNFDASTVSAVAGVGDTGAGKPIGLSTVDWKAQQGIFAPIAEVMEMPGRFFGFGTNNWQPAQAPSDGPQIEVAATITVPALPADMATGSPGGGAVPLPTPWRPAPLPPSLPPSYPTTSWTSPSGTGAIEEEMPRPSYPTTSWTSPSGTGAEEVEMPLPAPKTMPKTDPSTVPLYPTDPDL
jgi:hypothetical protein